MLIELIILLVISLLLASLAAPHFIRMALGRFFSTVQMTIYSPVSMRGITVHGDVGLWGLDNLTIYISSIQLGLVPKKLKLRLNITNLQIFGTRKLISFIPVNLIDGFQQPNILFNFLNYICTRQSGSSTQQRKQSNGPKNKNRSSTLHYFFQGMIHLIMLILLHVVEVNLVDFKAFVVSGLPKQKISFEDKKKHKKSLMLMQCLAEYSLYCDIISVQTIIQQHKNYQLVFKCSQIVCTSYLHWKNTFIEVKQINLDVKIPFSLSLSKSFEQLNFNLSIKEGHLNIIPTDFDHFFQFLKALTFNPYRKTAEKKEDENGSYKFQIHIDLIKIEFEDIQQYRDNEEAKEYLSNLNSAVITLEHLNQEENCFSVKMSTFTLTKYYREQTLSHIMEVLRIPELNIKTIPEACITEISHQSIVLDCHNEEIAFLGKIFSIINTRIKFENYNEDIYKNLVQNYIYGGTIISQMQKMLDLHENQKKEKEEIGSSKKNKIVYLPKKIEILLEMKKLRHAITLENFSYTRYNGYKEMSHEIVIDKLLVEYQEFKQFIVTDFKLTYSLTNKQNQLTMMINDITMNQNEQTLIDYLDSFTLFKQLLQFQNNETDTAKVSKLSKKNITIYKITLNINKETVAIKCLEVQKQTHVKTLLNNLYFSINQGSVSMSRLRPERKYFKPFINSSATIFNFNSFSIKETFEFRNNKPKSKVTIVLQEPNFALPEVKIAPRIYEYVQTFKKLESHIKAYIENVSNQKLQYIRYHVKSFLEEPPILCIIITKLKLAITDNRLNNTILGFSRTIREQLSQRSRYNEAKIISTLKRNNSKQYLLLDVQIQKIKVQLNPIRQLQPTQKSIQKYINSFLKIQQNSEERYRIKRVEAGNLDFKFKNIKLQIRDYPEPIMKISQILFDGSLMSVVRIFAQRSYFIQGCLRIARVKLNIGLNQLSGFNEVISRINQFKMVAQQEHKKKSMTVIETKYLVNEVLQNWRWNVSVVKNEQSTINIYTGNNPYDPDKFQLLIGKFTTQSHHQFSSVELESFRLFYKQFLIASLPDIKTNMKIFTIDNEFAIDVIIKVTSQAQINLSSSLIKYTLSLGQLHTDWLLIYGIYEPTAVKKQLHLDNIQSMNYIQIMNILVSDNSHQQSHKSILSLINRIKIAGRFDSLQVSLIQNDLQLSLKTQGVSNYIILEPDHELYNRLQIIRSKIQVQKLQSYFNKRKTVEKEGLEQPIQTDSTKQYNFVTCQRIALNFNWYFAEGKHNYGRANVWIGIGHIHGQFSKRMERYFIKMMKMFENNSNETIVVTQNQEKQSKKPLRRFRKAVYKVILINRRNRTKNKMIKKYKMAAEFFSYRMTLYHEDNSMILQSNNKAQFLLSTSYDEADSFHNSPGQQFALLFPESRLFIKEEQNSLANYQIMKTGVFKLTIHTPHKEFDEEIVKIGYCQFKDISVSLNQQNQNFLTEFIRLIISLVNTSEVRRKNNQEITDKYTQLKKMKRQPLKDKIEWKVNDIKLNEKKIFTWHFIFRDLSVTLSNEKGAFLYSNIGITDVKITIFNNTKVDTAITVSDFILNNELETPHGQFYNVLVMPPQSSGLKFKIESFDVQAFSQINWKYFNEMSIHIEPIKIKMTQQLLNCIKNFLVQSVQDQEEAVYDKVSSQYSRKIPDYIRLLSIEQMTFQLWLKSSSMFKRMEGIRVKLDEYNLKNKLYTKKDLLVAYSLWMLKQIGSQALSVLGQKVFGGNIN